MAEIAKRLILTELYGIRKEHASGTSFAKSLWQIYYSLMKNTLFCLLVTLYIGAVSVNAQFPQAERHQIKIDAAEKAKAAKEKAERERPVYPPARMNVDVQMVLTSTERKDFADARTAAVTKVA